MFDTLEADIICFQELKIQQRELTDGMVLVPGWDCYFTFPKHKKGRALSQCRDFPEVETIRRCLYISEHVHYRIILTYKFSV